MKVKVFTAWTEYGLEKKKVNAFLENGYIEVIDVKYASPMYAYSVMILYKE